MAKHAALQQFCIYDICIALNFEMFFFNHSQCILHCIFSPHKVPLQISRIIFVAVV